MIGGVEIVADAGDPPIAVEHRRLDRRLDVAPRVLEERDEVVSRMPGCRVLKIEQAERLGPADQHQILGMIVAQHGDRIGCQRSREHRIPCRAIRVETDLEPDRRAIPFDQQIGLAVQFLAVIGPPRPCRLAAQADQDVDRRFVEPQQRFGRGVDRLAHSGVAEILQQHEALAEVLADDRRRRKAP